MSDLRMMEERISALERKVSSMVRVGVVDTVDRTTCRVTVAFPGGFKSDELPVLVKQSVENRDFWMPAVDEQVLCVFLPTGSEVGFVVGSFYSDQDEIPEGADGEGMRMVEFGDGARFEYDSVASRLRVLVGELELEITPDHFRFGGETGTQSFIRGEDAIALIKAHVHPTGVGPSGPPSNAASFDATLSEIIKGR